jgi:hypothetical protein
MAFECQSEATIVSQDFLPLVGMRERKRTLLCRRSSKCAGEAFEKSGQRQSAVESYRTALAPDHDFMKAKDKLQALEGEPRPSQ